MLDLEQKIFSFVSVTILTMDVSRSLNVMRHVEVSAVKYKLVLDRRLSRIFALSECRVKRKKKTEKSRSARGHDSIKCCETKA